MNKNMNFYEFTEPYYSLIKAENQEEAVQSYLKAVADTEEGYEVKEVPDYYAIAKFSRCLDEFKKLVPLKEVLEQLESDSTEVLMVDGDLL